MKILSRLVILTSLVLAYRHVAAKPRPTLDDLRDRAAEIVAQISELDAITAQTVAKLVGRKIVATDQVTLYRREAHLAAGPVFSTATVVEAGKDDTLRIVDLTPEPSLKLTLAALEPALLDAPYEMRPWIVSTQRPALAGTEHHFATGAGELVVRVNLRDQVERILLTTDRTLDPKAATLRTQRKAPQRTLRPGR